MIRGNYKQSRTGVRKLCRLFDASRKATNGLSTLLRGIRNLRDDGTHFWTLRRLQAKRYSQIPSTDEQRVDPLDRHNSIQLVERGRVFYLRDNDDALVGATDVVPSAHSAKPPRAS